ncbi:hypothetical protein KX928_09815 [Roseobacter sp. YSTF-M11]|uniref:Uncharacterized protein n=1 Tax=Roseobacter insulae TaxID=2859783 RepID=A0A9X1FWB6_9RHOB|nr:hypothetical protein [Roseobacter insulae]MBW4708083.1 hypothetical protein [Roseobacter insulae]
MKRLSFVLVWLALPAVADVTSPSGKTVECYCTDKSGDRVELGQTICLQVDGRMFMAQCQMSLNVPMWREVQQGCLSSSLDGGDQPLQSFGVDAQI